MNQSMYGASVYGESVGVVPSGAQGMVVNHGGLVSNYGGNVQNMQVIYNLKVKSLHISHKKLQVLKSDDIIVANKVYSYTCNLC